MKELFLTLKKQWFDEILAGTKTEEYREIKPFMSSRLVGKNYDYIVFQNGYNPTSPRLKCKYLGYEIRDNIYVIKLSDPVQIR